jgi:F420-non-reducing hydrogenase iron-sulfur subunit
MQVRLWDSDAVEPLQNMDFEPDVVLLYCGNCVEVDGNLADSHRRLDGCRARFVMLPCSSKLEVRDVMKLLEQGADAVQVVGCADAHCRLVVGNRRAEKRVQYVRDLLAEIQLGPERAAMVRGERFTESDLLALASDRAARLRELGPNPMKATRTDKQETGNESTGAARQC